MPRPKITAISFRPPLAIARIGDSVTPMEAFTWIEDTRLFAAGKTILRPALTFRILEDGSIDPYMPNAIGFRDHQAIRPVCPFLELEAEVGGKGKCPLTGALLEEAGIELSQLRFVVTAANLKAKRRTGDPASAFAARLDVTANDHRRHELLAWTRGDAPDPLVLRDRPIRLGAFQVMRPVRRSGDENWPGDVIRVRFTPGRGDVYGPPFAAIGMAAGGRRMHQIVPEENRILNPVSSWCSYNYRTTQSFLTAPKDVYDGSYDLEHGDDSWGVVDDTCDAVITAAFATIFYGDPVPKSAATARVIVAPPHFSPDHRHLYSMAEDLADRDPESMRRPSGRAGQPTPQEFLNAVTDLFRRIYETAAQVDLEAQRDANLASNKAQNPGGFPRLGDDSMTGLDEVNGRRMMSDHFRLLADGDQGDAANNVPLLAKSEYAGTRHAELATPELLFEFLMRYPQRLRDVLRPPFRKMSDPLISEKKQKPDDFRDGRFDRSYQYDARMPPFLRDGDMAPLSLTRRQWDLLFEKKRNGTWAPRTALIAKAFQLLKKT